MPKDEYLAEVDEHDRVVGLRPRADFETSDLIHRSAYLLIIDGRGSLLLQQKALTKKWNPGKWTYPVAGSLTDESYEECIKREFKEAFGQALPLNKILSYKYFEPNDRAFKEVFLAKVPNRDLKPRPGYAGGWRWLSVKELKQELIDKPEAFAPPFVAGMNLIFEQKTL